MNAQTKEIYKMFNKNQEDFQKVLVAVQDLSKRLSVMQNVIAELIITHAPELIPTDLSKEVSSNGN